MKTLIQSLFLAAAGVAFSGCASNSVAFVTTTTTGVEINAVEGGQQSAKVGFERFEGVVMPMVTKNNEKETVYLTDAYPIYAEYEFHSGGLTTTGENAGLIIRQVFAIGRAAAEEDVRNKAHSDFQSLGEQGSGAAAPH